MLRFVSAHIPWNSISNLEPQMSYKALRVDLVLLSATNLSIICRRDDGLTVDVITDLLRIQNQSSLALDGWTSTNILAVTFVIAYDMNRN
jgi:hypothetical protein